jgi:hypothetical protein
VIKQEDIPKVFSLFHDGIITSREFAGGILRLMIQMECLAERIDPSFTQFKVVLYGAKDFRFMTWPNRAEEDPLVLMDREDIFLPQLQVLEGAMKGEKSKSYATNRILHSTTAAGSCISQRRARK